MSPKSEVFPFQTNRFYELFELKSIYSRKKEAAYLLQATLGMEILCKPV
jgi:hypothetical protein